MAKKFRDLVAKMKPLSPEEAVKAELEYQAMLTAVALGKLRERCGQTQTELATKLSTTQRNVSRIEHEEDLYLSTLREYVAALGGELELAAVFPDGRVLLDPRARSEARRAQDEVRASE